MGSNYLFLDNNNLELFFKIFTDSLSDYYFNEIIKLKDFINFIKYLNASEKTSFLLLGKNEPIGIFLSTIKKNEGYIPALGIKKEFRSMGYGRVLMQKGLSLLNENSVNKVSLDVLKDNNYAINLYKSEGFKIINEINNFRSEKNSFYSKEYFNDVQIINTDKFGFSIIHKNFHLNEKLPWQKQLNCLINKFEFYDPDLFIIKVSKSIAGYAVVSRNKNYMQLHDLSLKKNYDFLFRFFLTGLLKNENIVQANGYYKDNYISKLFTDNGFYIDNQQYEMQKVIL
ncbi:MAG: GNAT family N-acetyltransferase [Spirochaetes bacterium]|nr:GNAT family N-acetyltransferase [Spirochaetota bacterium]